MRPFLLACTIALVASLVTACNNGPAPGEHGRADPHEHRREPGAGQAVEERPEPALPPRRRELLPEPAGAAALVTPCWLLLRRRRST